MERNHVSSKNSHIQPQVKLSLNLLNSSANSDRPNIPEQQDLSDNQHFPSSSSRLSVDTAKRLSVASNSASSKIRKPSVAQTPLSVITSKPRSISFFVDLINESTGEKSPVLSPSCHYQLETAFKRHSLNPQSPQLSSKPHTQQHQESQISSRKQSLYQQHVRSLDSPWTPPQHPWAKMTPEQIASRMQNRLEAASLRRTEILNKKREKLRLRSDQINYRIFIQKQKEKLLAHKIRARMEFAISAADIKRQLIMKRNVEKFSAAVEHAQTVAMVQRLKKVLELRKAYSESFVFDFKELASSQGITTNEDFLNLLGGNPMGSRDFESEDQNTLTPVNANPTSNLSKRPSTTKRGSKSKISKSQLSKDIEVTVRKDSVEEIRNEQQQTLSPTSASPKLNKDVQPELSDKTETETVVELDTSADDNANPPSESLIQSIRRTQSLPDLLIEELEEVEYIELLDLLPPVTRFTLRELDLDEILNNPQLRHDLYFDPNLQFKPNLDGERGEIKQTRQETYWTETAAEFSAGKYYRVPLLVYEIRAIMLELLPPTGSTTQSEESSTSATGRIRWWREEIERNLDIRFISQQVDHNVLNVLGIVKYIAELLKANCAPARDELVDSMVAECEAGNIARTFRLCFELLELMKLDYANHQLHRLRPYVVEHAVDFEWRWFKDQLEAEALKVDDTTAWLKESFKRLTKQPLAASKSIPSFPDVYHEALIHLIEQSVNFSDSVNVPETLRMDTSRLVNFYNDWQDVTIMASLLIIFRQCCGLPKTAPANIKRVSPLVLDKECQEAKKTLWILLNDGETSLHHITLQISSMAGRVRNLELDERENALLSSLIDKTLSPESKVYELVGKRVASVLLDYLVKVYGEKKNQGGIEMNSDESDESTSESEKEEENSIAARMRKRQEELKNSKKEVAKPAPESPIDAKVLAKYGLTELETEIKDLCERISRLSEHNRAVYGPVYVSIYTELRGTA
ncbi:hypothetical protein HK098_002224 [Nowakowskiella sp. JEL0407]|nr:hypothetical protein HK098_002224 [Nowakowskiella sp. JEL0407]